MFCFLSFLLVYMLVVHWPIVLVVSWVTGRLMFALINCFCSVRDSAAWIPSRCMPSLFLAWWMTVLLWLAFNPARSITYDIYTECETRGRRYFYYHNNGGSFASITAIAPLNGSARLHTPRYISEQQYTGLLLMYIIRQSTDVAALHTIIPYGPHSKYHQWFVLALTIPWFPHLLRRSLKPRDLPDRQHALENGAL